MNDNSDRSFFAPPIVFKNEKEYLEIELQEMQRHRWVTVENMVKNIAAKEMTVEEYAFHLGLSGWELIDIIGGSSAWEWAERYAPEFHCYHWEDKHGRAA